MKLLLIISGSIAAEKCKEIIKQLSKRNVFINCIITDSAKKIINVNDIKNNINGKIFYNSSEIKNKMLHITLTRNADLVAVCPATANIIAKFANGLADDLATNSLIASNKQILFMPAMNTQMWENKINKINVLKLQKSGVEFIGPDYGYLSCKEIGIGRLSKTKNIINLIYDYLKKTKKLQNVKCLVTAGPTIEPIDPIRFISNYSSGKQGYEIAKQLMLAGAKVTLISGPTKLQPPPNVKIINIKTANEMYNATKKINFDVAIFAAAVTDKAPSKFSYKKIKKKNLNKILLKDNPDIIKKISMKNKNKKKLIIGFAAETDKSINNAKRKLLEKNCDLIVLNKIDKNNVFDSEYNKVILINKKNIKKFKRTTKINVAKILVNQVIEKIHSTKN